MRERSEMKSYLAANMCSIDQTVPSRTVEAEPNSTLNTLSPGKTSRWILPHELATPDRPTSSGLQSPVGAPVQFGPSPMTREYSATPRRMFHQLNGVNSMVEQMKKDVNSLVQ